MSGRSARTTGEISLLEDTADKAGAKVGTALGLVTLDGLKRVRVVGIYKIGNAASFGGALVSAIPLGDAQRWYGFEGKFTQVNLQAEPGVSQAELRDRVRSALGSRYTVQTGPEKAEADSQGIADLINGFLGPALLAFGGVAVLVGAFLIFNMFSITVAQRIREIAMLRTLGASRKQILSSVLLEALATALIGSLIGIFAGLLIAIGITSLFDAVGFGLPSSSPRLATTGVVLGLIVGFGVTLFSARLPRRARDQDPADGGAAGGRDAPARALRALLPHPRRAVRARRRAADRQRRDGLRRDEPAAARHGRGRRPRLPRGRDDGALRRPADGARRGCAAEPAGEPARSPATTRRAIPRARRAPPPR